MTSTECRGKAVQPHYGRQQAQRLGSLPTGLSSWINGSEIVGDTYGRLQTDDERKAFFDEFLKTQRAGFGSAWVAIYQTIDLIRQNDWYWRQAGFNSFDAFWTEQGAALFGQWAELEQTYQYAHLAAPHLFEVDYNEAKELAQQLAQFRSLPASMNHVDTGRISDKSSKETSSLDSHVDPRHYVKEMNSPDWNNGFQQGQRANSAGGSSRFARFARLRRDAPEIADQFLAGEYVKNFKNGTVQPDMVAAEIAAGIRKEGDPVRKRDGFAYCKKLSDKLDTKQLKQLQKHIGQLLESRE